MNSAKPGKFVRRNVVCRDEIPLIALSFPAERLSEKSALEQGWPTGVAGKCPGVAEKFRTLIESSGSAEKLH